MLVILEGPDCGGKSTIARALAEALRVAYPDDHVETLRKGPPSRHPLDEYEMPLYGYRPGHSRHIICDRWHVGEAVYPEVLNRATSWDLTVHRHVELFLRSRGALLVHVDPGPAVLRRRIRDRGDDLVREDQLLALRLGYAHYLDTTTLPTLRLTCEATPFAVEKIITIARALDRATRSLNPFVTYVGPPTPDCLLLGDVRHELRDTAARTQPERTIRNGVAFGPYPSTSGHYLLSHLPAELWHRSVGLANACDVDDVVELRRALGNPPTVALGVNAWRALRNVENNGNCAAAPHPQWVRRFAYNYGEAYGRVITDAVVYGKNELSWRPKR